MVKFSVLLLLYILPSVVQAQDTTATVCTNSPSLCGESALCPLDLCMDVTVACNGSMKFQILPSYPINEDECYFKSGTLATTNVSFELTGAGSSGEFTDVTNPPGEPDPKYRFTGVIATGNSQICATATVSITSDNGVVCEKTGTVCYTPEPGIYIGNENCVQEPNFSTYAAYFDNAPANLQVYLLSSLHFDTSHTAIRDWNIIDGATIIVDAGKSLHLEGAKFSTSDCGRLWQGIEAENEASVKLTDEAEISDAAFAIASYVNSNANITVLNSLLSENYEGIHTEYNFTEVTLENSTLTSPELKDISECISGINSLDLCGKGYAGVNIKHGHHLLLTTSNDFGEIGNGVLLQNTTAAIQRQSFANIFEECFEEKGGYSIKSLNTYDFQPFGIFAFNTFNNTDYAVQAEDRSGSGLFRIRRNEMSSVYRGVDLLLKSQVVDDNASLVYDNNIVSLSEGHFLPQRDEPIGIAAVTNDEEPAILYAYRNTINVQMPSAKGIWYIHTGTSSRLANSEIVDNILTMNDDSDQSGIRIDGEIGSLIRDNTVNGVGNPTGRIGIFTKGGEGNTLCDNNVNFGTAGVGIEVSGTEGQSISYNTLSGGEYGAKLDKNCIPQGIDENTILGSPTIGFYHESPAMLDVTDDQVDKRNVFPSGVMEVTTDGEERYFTQAFSGPTSLGDSPLLDRALTIEEGIRSCANVVGDITTSGFSGDSPGNTSNDAAPSYADMRQRIAEGSLSSQVGSNYDYQLGLFNELSRFWEFDERFANFYNSQNLRTAGILYEAKKALDRPTITSSEREILREARINLDTTGVRDILLRAAVLKRENVASAMELINSIQNGTVPELALRGARAALLNESPSSTELANWKTIAEGCYEEYGPAVYEFQRAYFAVTGQILQTRCLESRSPMQLKMKSEESKLVYTLAPNVTSSQVRIVGLEESVDIRVVDIYGKTVKQIQDLQPGQEVNLETLPAAHYMIVFDGIEHNPLRVIIQ